MKPLPVARVANRSYVLFTLILVLIGMAWTARHVLAIVGVAEGTNTNRFAFMWAVVFGSLVWHLVLSWSEKPYVVKTAGQQAYLNKFNVSVIVPCYNEDPVALDIALNALLRQSRPPQTIVVVDDGSNQKVDEMHAVLVNWQRRAAFYCPKLVATWVRTENQGKRHAQLKAMEIIQSLNRRIPTDRQIYCTMDSDTVVDPRCIEEGLKPFIDERVNSVASVILAYNNDKTFVRLTDPWLLAFQLAVRSAMSKLGCVMVNSGNFSLYRSEVIIEAKEMYESETFAGHGVQFSDDSLLTLLAHCRPTNGKKHGRTVQQPTSFAFTILPDKISHHIRQQLRWMRGSTIRSIWRFRYLPLNGAGYWEHFFAWLNFLLISYAFVEILVYAPLVMGKTVAPLMFLFTILVSYVTALKYLTIRRSDQTLGHQVVTFLLTPIMLAWTALVLRPLRIYAIFTCWKTGWGTRQKVEVTA